MTDVDERLARLELKLEQSLAIESRLSGLEEQLDQLTRKSTLLDWLQTLGPYLGGLVVLIVGFALKDSVTQAMEREQLNLEYVKQMRDLIQDFDAATDQSAADANAIGLAMYGRYAIAPLIERLKGGDVANIAAERGLHLAAANDPAGVCPRLGNALIDPAHQLTWQAAKTLTRVIGAADCVPSLELLESRLAAAQHAGPDQTAMAQFAAQFANAGAVDFEVKAKLTEEMENAIELLEARRDQPSTGEQPWWQ